MKDEYDIIEENIAKMNIVLDLIIESTQNFHSMGLEIETHEKHFRDAWKAHNREAYNTILEKCKRADENLRVIKRMNNLYGED